MTSAEPLRPPGAIALLVVGVLACSTAAIFIKLAPLEPVLIAAWRLLIGGTLLTPLLLRARRRHPEVRWGTILRTAGPAAVLLALHFWSWNDGLRRSIVANASLIVNLTAPIMPVMIWLLLRERITRREVIGTAIALSGVLVLAVADIHLTPEYLVGDLICFASMLAFTLYLVWGRRSRRALPSIWLYLPPVYLIAGLLCLAGGALTTDDILPRGFDQWWPLLGLGLIPTVIGHSILNRSMQVLPSQSVAVVNLGQFIPATIMAWLVFSELPGWDFPFAAALIIGGSLTVIRNRRG